jgi:hypothetical protein
LDRLRFSVLNTLYRFSGHRLEEEEMMATLLPIWLCVAPLRGQEEGVLTRVPQLYCPGLFRMQECVFVIQHAKSQVSEGSQLLSR